MCDFHEPYFGASYPDACCIDGYLWDLDSCHVPGGPLHKGGDDPCPQCNHEAWLEHTAKEDMIETGWTAFDEGQPREFQPKDVRHEQPGDKAKLVAWWQEGWDMGKSESDDLNRPIINGVPAP